MQTRPSQLKVEVGANTLTNQTVNIKISNRVFIITINSAAQDLTFVPYANEEIFVILFAKQHVIVQGRGFQARINKDGDIFLRLGSKYFKKVTSCFPPF